MANSIYQLTPLLDEDGYECLAADDLTPVAHGPTLLDDFCPHDVTENNWKVARLAPVWRPREVVNPLPGQVNDFPCLGLSVPTFSQRAVDALREFLEPNGEILPLKCDHGTYYAYNVTTVADVLDRERSIIKWPGTHVLKKRPLIFAEEIRHYEFRPDGLTGLSIFRFPEDITECYVTDTFAECIADNDLKGFDLKKVWPLRPPGK